MKIFLALPFFISAICYSQVLADYPRGQAPYIGGYEAFYKDFREIIREENLQPCTDAAEFYQFSVLVNPDASINYVKDFHSDYLKSNKCAADLAREVARRMTKWKPATVNGIKQPAVARFEIYPVALFQDTREEYSPSVTPPIYNNAGEKHLEHFWKQLKANFDLRRFRWEDLFTVEAEFIVTKEGKLEDIILTKKTGLEEFDRMIFYAFKGMKKKWNPATVDGKPVDYRFKYQLNAITDPED